ncbi:MAG TPA: PTS ascorbate transporter subunit IIC [Pelolinea sp.]|nr:PTS ascorbate transporter subunit IIC [Pelolinea sp.]
MNVLDFLMKDIIGTPALLIGIIAALGLILQKKPFSEIIGGGVKTATGYLILQGGAGIVVGVLLFLGPMIEKAFGLSAPAAGGIGYDVFLKTWGGYATASVAVGFIVNLLLARFTPFKYVYLTGHLMIFGAECVLAGLIATFVDINPLVAIITTGVVLGIYWTLQPAVMQKFMKGVTKTDDLAYGHTSALGCWLAAVLGKFVGKPEQSSEEVELPQSLEIFKDTVISLSIVLGVFTVVVALFAGPEAVAEHAGSTNYITFALLKGFTFGAGISIILYGVRLIIGELVPAFRGVSKVLVPGAKPALDCPIIFPYAPTAVVIGFISSFLGFVIGMLIIGGAGWGVVIPNMITVFFPGAAAGVYGNSTGGWKGAILGGLIMGLLLAFGQLVTGHFLAARNSVPFVALDADPDTHLLPLIGGALGNLLKSLGL